MIASLLDTLQDLYYCTLVCRDWHNVLNPILWGHIEDYCDPNDPEEDSPFICSVVAARSLEKYGHYIRTLKIECSDKDLQQFLAVAPDRFSRLHSIELIGFKFSDDVIANLLHRCSRRCGGVGLRSVVLNPDDCSYWGFDENEFDFGEKSVEALKDHFPTLEVFRAEAAGLESGLDLLSGLKNLRVVALEDMEVDIDGDSEQKWVAEHWPKARVITTEDGTERDDDSQLSGFYDEDSDEEFERHPEYLDLE
ncbi:hypothetical protein BGZ59_004931 [Podila verticillata]|nr:hypothetical protein BGZ59_004931 [Podila verticillata]